MSRLANVLGKPLYVDQVTSNQDRITYARVLINTDITISYKNKAIVEDEDGKILTLKVEYKWKPLVCSKCKSIDHVESECEQFQQQKKTRRSKKPNNPKWRRKVQINREMIYRAMIQSQRRMKIQYRERITNLMKGNGQ